MTSIFGILMVQAFLGLADNVINHEWALRLPARRSAAREMGLHAARHFAYGILFGGLAWFEWHGSWAAAMAALKGARAPGWWRKPYYMGRPNGAGSVAVTGATGFVGRHLVRQLVANGNAVVVKTTDAENAQDLFGPYVTVVTAMTAIPATTPVRAVVNLAGAPIMPIPWTTARRATLMASRVQTTQAIVDWIKGQAQKPAVLVGVSGIGFYGAMPNDREVDERKITRLKSNARALDEHHGDGGHGDRGHGDRGRTGDRQHNDHAMRGRDFQAQLCDGCRAGRLGAGSGNATTGALDANSGPAVGA